MDDKENRQKTVVAFIAGLLIGGILVYIFSAIPQKKAAENADNASTTGSAMEAISDAKGGSTSSSESTEDKGGDTGPKTVIAEKPGAITIDDQFDAATNGAVVKIASLTMPSNAGWVVVHEVNADGSLGRALGAARFNQTDGLVPKQVDLLRATVVGKNYMAVVYSENGDKVFDLKDDKPVAGADGKVVEDAFTAAGAAMDTSVTATTTAS